MQNVILVIHIIACVVLVAVVLLQKSEGGALGIGGGGGGMMTSRGAAGALVRTTMLVGGVFFLPSLGLTTLANRTAGESGSAVEDTLAGEDPASVTPRDPLDPSTPLLGEPRAVPPAAEVIAPPLDLPEETLPETGPGPDSEEPVESPRE